MIPIILFKYTIQTFRFGDFIHIFKTTAGSFLLKLCKTNSVFVDLNLSFPSRKRQKRLKLVDEAKGGQACRELHESTTPHNFDQNFILQLIYIFLLF